MADPYVIRAERIADRARIGAVVSAAFGSQVEADLVDRIRASKDYVPEMALVAVCTGDRAGEIIGHVMISGALLRGAHGERRIVMLAPLSVLPADQRRGVGGALVRAVTSIADQLGEPLVVLEGSPRYYPKFGFEPATPLGLQIDLPEWAPPEAAQVLLLAAYRVDDPSVRGVVVYPPAFDGVG